MLHERDRRLSTHAAGDLGGAEAELLVPYLEDILRRVHAEVLVEVEPRRTPASAIQSPHINANIRLYRVPSSETRRRNFFSLQPPVFGSMWGLRFTRPSDMRLRNVHASSSLTRRQCRETETQ